MSGKLRAIFAALLLCGVGFAVGLSVAPQLHDWLHKTNSDSHECAATLLSNGNWEHSACEPVLIAPPPAPVTPFLVTPGLRVIARAESSVLEHAPPAKS